MITKTCGQNILETVERMMLDEKSNSMIVEKIVSMVSEPGPKILNEVAIERERQDRKWGGPEHDDSHSVSEFVQWIQDYSGWARMMASMRSRDKTRKRLVQVAALAVAAVESLDRKKDQSAF